MEQSGLEGSEAAAVSAGEELESAFVVSADFEKRCDTFVEPAWQAVDEMPAVELMPAFVSQRRERPRPADIVRYASALEAIGALDDLEIDIGVGGGEVFGELLPLGSVGKEVCAEPGLCVDGFGELALVGAVCRFHEAGDLAEHERVH